MSKKLLLASVALASLFASNINVAYSAEVDAIKEENIIEDFYDILVAGIFGEYYGNWGLNAINAEGAYERGYTGLNIYTGQPINVAVVDRQVLYHKDLEGNILRMYPYKINKKNPSTHGTHVAGTIVAKQGNGTMHGVAYDANVVPIDLFDDYDNFRYNIATAINNYDVKIFNNSWGAYDSFSDKDIPIVGTEGAGSLTKGQILQEYSDELGIFRDAAASDAIMVFSAGNEEMKEVGMYAGLPYYFPELKGHWVAVAAVDRYGDLASFSNHCGVAAEWCISAPGVGIKSTVNDSGFGKKSGTSMAAPHVTGALAVMQGAFPYLSSPELLQIMFYTADAMGPRNIYGHGMLNLDKATTPSGYVYYSLNDTLNGKRIAASNSKLQLSPAMKVALASKDVKLHIHDEIPSEDGPIKRMFVQKAKFNSLDRRENHQLQASIGKFSDEPKTIEIDDETSFKIYGISKEKGDLKPRVKFTSNLGSNKIEVARNLNLSEANSWQHLDGQVPVTMHNAKSTRPFSFTDKVDNSVNMSSYLTEDTKIVTNYTNSDDKTNQSINGELVKKFADNSVSLLFGNNLENNQFLGSKNSGFFKLNDKADTKYYGAGFSSKASDNVVVFGNYIVGETKGDKINDSFFTNISNVRSSAGLIGAGYKLSKNEKVTFIYSKPLTIDKGSVSYRNAAGVDKLGKLHYTNEQVSLTPKDKAQNLELHYAMKIDDDSDFNLSASQNFNSYENEGKNEAAILMNYKARF